MNASGRGLRQRGLTLIELLVAISVLAFVAVLGWRGLDGIVRARVSLNADLEQTRGMQLAFAQLQNDCANIITPALVPNRTPLAVDQGRLRLVRMVFGYNQPLQLQVITYQVRNGVLTRRESAPTRDLQQLDAMWQEAVNDADTTNPNPAVEMQSGVVAMTMRLWANDNNGWRDAEGAQPTVTETPTATQVAGLVSRGSQLGAVVATAQGYTGLEVSLQLQGKADSMIKVLLLGAV